MRPGYRYKTEWATRELARIRREELRGQGLCINGARHGRATHGVRCEHCHHVHSGTA